MIRLARRASMLAALSLLVSVATALADSSGRTEGDALSLTIDADSLDRANDDRLIIFTGTVVARQRYWRMDADRVEVSLGEKARLLLVTATGNVRVATSDCWKGTAERAEYDDREQHIVLSGKVELWRDRRVISGDDIVIRLPRVSAVECAWFTVDPRGPKGE